MTTVKLPPMTLRYEGLFDFDGLYREIITWAKTYGYIWHEEANKHKAAGKGAELEFDWSLTQEVTEFIQYKIVFEVHAWDLTDVDVVVDNKKKTLSNARIHILMKGSYTYDWQERFSDKSKFGAWLKNLYYKAKSSDIDEHFDKLYYRMWNLQSIIKKYLDMQGKKHVYKSYLAEN